MFISSVLDTTAIDEKQVQSFFSKLTLEKLLYAAVLLVLCAVLIKLILKAADKLFSHSKLDHTIFGFLRTTAKAILIFIAVMLVAGTLGVETVVLLSHKKADSYIHIDVEFGEGEGKIPVDSIAKRAEAYKPKEKVTYKMIKEYIEAKYGFKVHTAYIAEVKRNLGLPMYDAPNAVEELKQPRKHPTPEKVEAIKDALRYFAVI